MDVSVDEKLDELYSDVGGEAAFARPTVLYKVAKNSGLKVTLKRVKEFLNSKPSHTEFRPVRKRNFKRNKLRPRSLHESWWADLAVLTPPLQTGRNKFLLVVIESLSRQIYAKFLKSKKADAVAHGLQLIFDEVGFKPGTLITDQGTEFLNETVQSLLRNNHIGYHPASTTHPSKAFMAEMAIRQLMTRVYRVLKERNSRRLDDELLTEVLQGLNSRKMKSLGNRSPNEVTLENQLEVAREQQAAALTHTQVEPIYDKGQRVLVQKLPSPFQKAFKGTAEPEILIVDSVSVVKGGLPTYKLRDIFGASIVGQWYADQLVPVV